MLANESQPQTAAVHYDAFISYRHTSRDMKIAKTLQHQLEHYPIPKEIQARTGKKRFERVFRDKEELRASDSLTGELETALSNSDYLIIICSTEATKSNWVPVEIEAFLESHPRSHILTVLSEGDYPDIIPPSVAPISPSASVCDLLSADYRSDLRTARKKELPRLVATMLGCTYDELIQRRKQYLRNRIIVALSCMLVVLAVLLFYFVRTNHTIAAQSHQLIEQNRELKRNNSISLAMTSEKFLNEQQRIEAVQWALDAAEYMGDVEDCPPQTVLALQRSTNAYMPKLNNRLIQTRAFQSDALVDVFAAGESCGGCYLASLDHNGQLTLWNIDTGEKLAHTLNRGGVAYRYVAIVEDALYLVSDTKLFIVQLPETETIMTLDMGEYYYPAVVSGEGIFDGGVILRASKGWGEPALMIWRKGSDVFETFDIEEDVYLTLCASQDGRWAVWSTWDSKLYVMDCLTGTQTCLDEFEAASSALIYGDKVIVLGHRTSRGIGTVYNSHARKSYRADNQEGSVACYSLTTGEKLWENTSAFWLPGYGSLKVLTKDETGLEEDCLFAYANTMGRTIDLTTGETKNEIPFTDRVLCTFCEDYYADGSLTAILADGSYNTVCFDNFDVVRHINMLPRNLFNAAVAGRYVIGLQSEYEDYAVMNRFTSYAIDGIETIPGGKDTKLDEPTEVETDWDILYGEAAAYANWNSYDEKLIPQMGEDGVTYTGLRDAESGAFIALDPPVTCSDSMFITGLKDGLYKWSDSGESVLFLTAQGLTLYSQEGKALPSLHYNMINNCYFCFLEDSLFLLEDDAIEGEMLTQYSAKTGEYMHSVQLSSPKMALSMGMITPLEASHTPDDKYIIRYTGYTVGENDAYILNNALEVEQVVENATKYDPESDQFEVIDYLGELHQIPRLTISDLIEMARAQLK